jgi:hypothetical protein
MMRSVPTSLPPPIRCPARHLPLRLLPRQQPDPAS